MSIKHQASSVKHQVAPIKHQTPSYQCGESIVWKNCAAIRRPIDSPRFSLKFYCFMVSLVLGAAEDSKIPFSELTTPTATCVLHSETLGTFWRCVEIVARVVNIEKRGWGVFCFFSFGISGFCHVAWGFVHIIHRFLRFWYSKKTSRGRCFLCEKSFAGIPDNTCRDLGCSR